MAVKTFHNLARYRNYSKTHHDGKLAEVMEIINDYIKERGIYVIEVYVLAFEKLYKKLPDKYKKEFSSDIIEKIEEIRTFFS